MLCSAAIWFDSYLDQRDDGTAKFTLLFDDGEATMAYGG